MKHSSAALLGALALVPAAGAATGVRLAVSPASVAPGGSVLVRGNAGTCPAGDTVQAISRAFPGRAFGGEGALGGRVRTGGGFAIHGRVRVSLKPGRYAVTARCGGGNLGKVAYVRIR